MDKIRILFIHDSLVCGGAEQALYDLMRLLDPEKFETAVLVQKPGNVWDEKFREAGLQVVYDYSCRQPTWNPVKKAENVVRKMRTQKAYRKNGEGLLEACYPQGADIVVSYSMWDYPLCGFLPGAKTVKFIHGNMDTDPAFRELILRDRELLPRYDRIVCVSENARKAFMNATGRTEGVETHFNPINSDRIRSLACEPVELPTDKPMVCAVGRLSSEKGFERLIVQHKRLVEEGTDHYLVIVGDGPDRDYIARTVRAMDAQNTVILAGYQANPYPYMKQSRMVVCPSYTEGLSVIALESLCLGVPVVSTVPSVGEMFDGESCGIVTENDNESLRNAMRRMLTDQVFYSGCKAGAECRGDVFTGKYMVKELEDMFAGLV